jgi:hypothetical protein
MMRTILLQDCVLREPLPSECIGEGFYILLNRRSQLPICAISSQEFSLDTIFDVAIALVPTRRTKGEK